MNEKLKSWLKGAAIAAAGAAIVYAGQLVGTGKIEEQYGPVAAAVVSMVVNALRLYLRTKEGDTNAP